MTKTNTRAVENKDSKFSNRERDQFNDSQYTEAILIVDDELHHLNSLKMLIESEKYSVTVANSASEAIEILNTSAIDLLLLDLNMPEMGGVEVMRHINAQKMDTTVIVVSGETTFEAAENALKYGAYEYVRKPYSIEGLLNSLKNAFKKRQLEFENHAMQLRLLKSENLHRYIVNQSPDIVYMLDVEGRFTFVNDRLEKILGYNRDEVLGKHYSTIVHDDDFEIAKYSFNERRTGKRASSNVELRLKCKGDEGHAKTFESRLLPITISSFGMYQSDETDGKYIGTYGIARDITEKKESEKIIHFQAYHDALTHLPNRALLKDRIEQAISQAKRKKHKLSVMFLDLDRFKNVNDTLGHIVGDELLQKVASRLKTCIRECDTLARIGGDEFTILLSEVHGKSDSVLVAKKILEAFDRPFYLDKNELFMSTSIGIAHYPDDGVNIETLLKHADIAMYAIKNSGKNGYKFYADNMHKGLSTHLSLENDLHRAISNEQFRVFYQPQINVLNNEIVALEALIRWQHPERGLISPVEFISCCEETGLIQPIGDWVIDKVCDDLSLWKTQGLKLPKVAINISAKQFDRSDLAEKISAVLEKYDISGEMLEVEITENALMEDIENVVMVLNKLSAFGVTIAIDDFGTGYSSLNYLQKLPIDILKIDRSFIDAMNSDQGAESIVEAIIAMAKGLKLEIISEGVEDINQLELLKSLGCYNMQGYLFSRPVAKDVMTKFLSAHKDTALPYS